jgi:hypothetical protein
MASQLMDHLGHWGLCMQDVQGGTLRQCCQSWQLREQGNLCYLEHWSGVRLGDLTTQHSC